MVAEVRDQICIKTNKMKKILVSVLLTGMFLWAGVQTIAAQDLPEILWDKTIGGNFADGLARIYPAPDGGWYLFGTSSSSVGFEKSANPSRPGTRQSRGGFRGRDLAVAPALELHRRRDR